MSSSEGENYEVDVILDSRKRGRTLEYLVRWKGFGEEEDSWEPSKNLASARPAIDLFNKKSSSTPVKTKSGVKTSTKKVKAESTSGSTRSTSRKTVTTTTLTQSEASSPENSPVLSRRTVRTETVEERRSAKKEAPPTGSGKQQSLPGWMSIRAHDWPIIILVACLLLIFSTFVYERFAPK